jgi:hypothetical protein
MIPSNPTARPMEQAKQETVLLLRLGMEGQGPVQIAEAVQEAYAKGELPRMEPVASAYMFSADQDLGPGVGGWHPHLMVCTPFYENSMLGGNEVESSSLC